MKATLTFGVDVSSPQKAAALRDKCAEWLNEDDDVTVISQSMSQDTHAFKVVGVDTSNKQPFVEHVEDTNQENAGKQVVGSSKSKVVAEVTAA